MPDSFIDQHPGLAAEADRLTKKYEEGKRRMNGHGAEARDLHNKSEGGVEPIYSINPAKWQDKPVPERRWIVPDWIPFGVTTGLYGPPGYGKTLIAQQLMTARAVTKPWLGCFATHGKSIAFLCEDDEDELHRRQEAINEFYGCSYEDIGPFVRFVPRLGCDNVMMTFKDGLPQRTPFYEQVREAALSFGANQVVIDTVADTFGGNQNDSGHARQFVQGLAAIASAINGSVLACAHPSQSGRSSGSGESGSVQWDAAFRSRMYLDAPKTEAGEAPDDSVRILTRKKANYARRGDTIDLTWRKGVFTAPIAATGILGSIDRRTCERVFLDLLRNVRSEGQHVSVNSRAGNYAPRVFSERPDRERFTKADFSRAMQGLLSVKQIVIGSYKDASRHDHEELLPAPETGPRSVPRSVAPGA